MNTVVSIPIPNISAIVPEIIATALACFLLIFDLFVPKDRKRVVGIAALIGCVILTVVTWGYFGKNIVTFSGMFILDNFAVVLKLLFLVSDIVIILISLKYLELEGVSLGEYYALLVFATVGMMIMASANDLIMVYLGLETMALSVYVLAGFMRMTEKSAEAALKYFLMGVFISGIFLFGIAFTYGVVGSTNLKEIAQYISMNGFKNPLLGVAIILIAAGLGLEIAMAPFHFWAPDVYEGAPTSVTAFISVAPKVAAIAALFRVYAEAFSLMAPYWKEILWLVAALTMTIGNVTAVLQNNVKRLLAYSSIAHAGYMLLGILAFNQVGVAALAFYFFAYCFMNIGAFGIVIYLRRNNIVGDNLEDFKGLAQIHPMLALVMVIFLLSLTGIPPTVGFVGKFLLFSAAVKAGYYWLVAIAVLNSVISLYYYFKIAKVMYMENPETTEPLSAAASLKIAVFALGILTIVFGLYPHPLINLAQMSIKSFF
ncbi:NADH-quinone oxidoreductase subunit N [Thermosulfidibacter takaii ABI70S6]|uniref:NADH-quinone oxidoreductase subunit N n=1 Tax=Thermosulfidibacter takaii (strain DSM 17441 / JCM 13301 / NBRC 103674 / ABI70S6) TaxID=1298851 RepID=A0A0S3QVD1_THET7|nr:NADH-quinone oxidoreductase subunit N [Thermosulfidibacter takaii]BAT72288.1 NADH-quinone oxidoreductase subunit N [Thermosulfidibacter takaii ABI70S6]